MGQSSLACANWLHLTKRRLNSSLDYHSTFVRALLHVWLNDVLTLVI